DGIRDATVTGVQTCALPILRLVGDDQDRSWDSRGHFFAAAAEAMRRILVEKARRKRRLRHGGGLHKLPLEDIPVSALPLDPIDEIGRAACRESTELVGGGVR